MFNLANIPSTIYIEAVEASTTVNDIDISLILIVSSEQAGQTSENVTAVNLDLDVANVGEAVEQSQGAFISLNRDDDNNNNNQDRNDSSSVNNEDDLVPFNIDVNSSALSGTVTLEALAGSDKIRVWANTNKTNRINLPKNWTIGTDNIPNIVYVEGNQVSSSLRDTRLNLRYSTFNDPITITVAQVAFSRAGEGDNQNKYGYDEVSNGLNDDDHISVMKNDETRLVVTYSGLPNANDIYFVPQNSNIATTQKPSSTPSGFLLKINGGNTNKGETAIEARLGSASGPVAATVYANVYRKIDLQPDYFLVHQQGNTNDIPGAVDTTEIEQEANVALKPVVAQVTLNTPTQLAANYDLNNSGRIDYYINSFPFNETTQPELFAIYNAMEAAGGDTSSIGFSK